MEICKYSEVNKESYLNYIEEWNINNEKIIPYASRNNEKNFKEMLEIWKEQETDIMYERNLVPSILFFFVDEETNIIWVLHFRHELNVQLLLDGGHIGLGIRPSERNKGYGTIMLSSFLLRINNEKYSKILVTCDESNFSSARIIEKNFGVLENIISVDGNRVKRYWINL